MLKTIPTNQVKLGMYINSVKGAWVNHPFWKTSFTLEDPEDLKKLQASSVKEVVINVTRGWVRLRESIQYLIKCPVKITT